MSDDEKKTQEGPHDSEADEPLGPATPDDESEAGDTPEVHDTISPHDLPKDHPGRKAAEEMAAENDAEGVEGNT